MNEGIGTAQLSFGPWAAGPWRVTIVMKPADDLWSRLKASSHDGRSIGAVVDLASAGRVSFDCVKVARPAGAPGPDGWIFTPSLRSRPEDGNPE